MARASELGVSDSVHFLQQVDEINAGRRRQRAPTSHETSSAGTFAGRTVAVLGAAFKPETDDVRDSPALSVAAAISAQGATVRVHDPKAIDNARRSHPELEYVDRCRQGVRGRRCRPALDRVECVPGAGSAARCCRSSVSRGFSMRATSFPWIVGRMPGGRCAPWVPPTPRTTSILYLRCNTHEGTTDDHD